MVRLFLFLIGFGMSAVGFAYIISYLNLMSLGYNFIEYVQFICRKLECLWAFIGLFIIFLVIFLPTKEDK